MSLHTTCSLTDDLFTCIWHSMNAKALNFSQLASIRFFFVILFIGLFLFLFLLHLHSYFPSSCQLPLQLSSTDTFLKSFPHSLPVFLVCGVAGTPSGSTQTMFIGWKCAVKSLGVCVSTQIWICLFYVIIVLVHNCSAFLQQPRSCYHLQF